MYLKSIEIQGFKSFANKMVFEFHDGITAIVGPNGSGKSNVADAVRWVLGEQSARQLRGAKMEDVIFQGTEIRKPQGLAYVAITLDNSDHKLPTSYEELTVARRVYRSGESEYLINNGSCRLRDVQELFLDTGIGKEGYSIIGQGQIDKILSGKPEERRELFDEAAGIVKFKKRKAAAEKNLESEKQNLYRVKDILAELENQVKPLEKQSQTAKEYLKLRDELKSLEVNLFLMEQDQLQETKKETEENYSIVAGDLKETREGYESTREEYERLEFILEEQTFHLEENKNRLNDTKLKKEQLEGTIKVLKEQIIAAKQNDGHYQERMEALEQNLAGKSKELNQYKEKKSELKEKLSQMDDSRIRAEELLCQIQNEMDEMNQCIEDCSSEIFQYLNENTNIKTKRQRYETMLEQNTLKKAGLNQKILKFKSDEAAFLEALGQEEEHLNLINQKIEELKSFLHEKQEEIHSLEEAADKIRKEKGERQQELIRINSKLESLKNMTERYEGYGQSIRRVMEQKEKTPGILGVVADIIKVDKRYETAIETALGGSIQNIVTDHENTAKEMIEYLKRNQYGRATFLPLTAIKAGRGIQNEEALKEPGVIGRASGLVETEQRFFPLVEHLLGRILVVDHIDHALAIQRKYKSTLRIVTLEGEQLNPGGSMSGGAYRNTSSLLGRRREMEQIEKEAKVLTKKLANLEQDHEKNRSQRERRKEVVEESQKSLQALYLDQNTARLKYNQAQEDKESAAEGFLELSRENKELDSQIRELKGYMEELSNQLLENERKSKENEARMEGYNRELEKKKDQRKQVREQNASLQIDYSSMEQNNLFLMENMKRIKMEMQKLKEEQRQLNHSLLDSGKLVAEREAEIVKQKEAIDGYEEGIRHIQTEIGRLEQEKETISGKHKGFFAKREKLSDRMIELEREISRLKGQIERLGDQSEQQMDYMWQEYELTYQGALALKTDTGLSHPQIKKSIGEWKGRIKALGQVNVNAISDYKNLSERYELLKAQHDDLIEAEEVLKGIILELDSEMRKQFQEKFQEIRFQFDVVFKELFGGGKGTIELNEDEDILVAGIRIIAQPPGKKLQNMMQLSGGEKALTAISLLFAIQNLKPSPFCLLDEIEAALDDSNVNRFARYLHKLTKDTQFIVITHRRGTMSAADILYGITMQEKGVSTLVSVNLIEDELDKEPERV